MQAESRKIIELQARRKLIGELIELLESFRNLQKTGRKDAEPYDRMIEVLAGLKQIIEHNLMVALHPAPPKGRTAKCWQCEASIAADQEVGRGWITFPFYKDPDLSVVLCPVHASVLLSLVPLPPEHSP